MWLVETSDKQCPQNILKVQRNFICEQTELASWEMTSDCITFIRRLQFRVSFDYGQHLFQLSHIVLKFRHTVSAILNTLHDNIYLL